MPTTERTSLRTALRQSRTTPEPAFRPGAILAQPVGISLVAALLWIIPWLTDNAAASVSAAGVGSILGFGWFWGVLKSPGRIVQLLEVGAVALVTILNSSFVVAWASTTFGIDRNFTEAFQGLDLTFANYALAIIYAMLFCLVMASSAKLPGLQYLEKHLLQTLLAIKSIKISTLSSILGFCILINLAALGSGIVSFRAIQTEASESGRIAWFLPFLFAVFSIQVALNSLLILKATSKKKQALWSYLLGFFSIACVTFIYFNQGRRAFVMAVVMHFIYYCLFKGSLPRVRTMIVCGLVALVVLPVSSNLFQLMRGGSGITASKFERGTNALEAVQRGLSEMGDERNSELARSRSLQNLATRPLIANPLARCIALGSQVKNFMWGQCIISSFVWTLPRVIAPWKVRYPPAEGLLFYYFPDLVFRVDKADSLYLYSYADFSIFGLLIYPFLVAALWFFALVAMQFIRRPIFVWFIFCSWPPQFILAIGEGNLISWFVLFRNTLMFVGLFWVFEQFIIPNKQRPMVARKTNRMSNH